MELNSVQSLSLDVPYITSTTKPPIAVNAVRPWEIVFNGSSHLDLLCESEILMIITYLITESEGTKCSRYDEL